MIKIMKIIVRGILQKLLKYWTIRRRNDQRLTDFYTATSNRVTGGRAGKSSDESRVILFSLQDFPCYRKKTVIIAEKTCFHHIISLTPQVLPFWMLQQCRTVPYWNTKICHDSSIINAVFTDQSCTSPEFQHVLFRSTCRLFQIAYNGDF